MGAGGAEAEGGVGAGQGGCLGVVFEGVRGAVRRMAGRL